MDSKHIERDYSAHRKSVIRPSDEYVKLEIFSFDPKYTKTYLRENKTLKGYENTENTSWKSWSCFKSADMQSRMKFKIKYNVKLVGDYRIDLIYEQNNYIHTNSKKNTGKDLTGTITLDGKTSETKFDGENNVLKRKTIYHKFTKKGAKTIDFTVPYNCYFYGVIIRKIVKYVGDNYYGSALGSEEGNMILKSSTLTISDKLKPSELSCEVAYDDSFECETSQSGFYIDYRDEVNFYVKTNDNKIKRVFGGYVSSILPDSDRTKLTIACADRLSDGTNKYILDQMRLGGGTGELKETGYTKTMNKDFNSYPQALKYLCDIHEVTLKSNISKQYTVDGEKFHKGLVLRYGTSKNIKKITASNGTQKVYKNFLFIRNKSDSSKQQVWNVYDASKHTKKPPKFTQYPYMHITYGLGKPKSESKSEITQKVDTSETTAGSQKFTKCGVSQDGKYLMAIGLPSAGKDSVKGFTKTVFKRKCPYCGSSQLYWGFMWSGNFPCTKKHNNGSAGKYEGHIYCDGCDMDFSVQGWEHKNGSNYHLEKVSKIVSSSKSEAYKLSNGEMVAVPSTAVTVTSDDVFKAITKIAFKYRYNLQSGASSYAAMKKSGKGECWAFSDLIFTEMKKYNISCKIVQYPTGMSGQHRSVLYKNEKNKWVDFPYREYGWGKKYNNMLNNTSASKSGHMVKEHKGNNIGKVQATTSTSKTQKTTVTTTTGYDKSKPFQAYIRLTYSLKQSFKAKKYSVNIKFTQTAPSSNSINEGTPFPLYWVNNTIKNTTLKLKSGANLVEYLKTIHGASNDFYLHSIQFVAPKQTPSKTSTGENKDVSWYKSDKSTKDGSSCKLNLYQIVFDDNPSVEPANLQSCGKSVNSMMQDLTDEAGYYVNMSYGLHRKDDKINFRVNNQTDTQYTATEGDNNNILSWNSISYSPIGSLFNMSMQVFKEKNTNYKYIDTKDSLSILNYGEQCTIKTNNDILGKEEAYFNAYHSDKFNPSQTYTYTITVPNCPNLNMGDLVKVIANAKKLNSVKEVNSIKIAFDIGKIPRVQTTLGLGELAPDIQLAKNIRKLRDTAKKETTEFSGGATPVTDEIYYEWDR